MLRRALCLAVLALVGCSDNDDSSTESAVDASMEPDQRMTPSDSAAPAEDAAIDQDTQVDAGHVADAMVDADGGDVDAQPACTGGPECDDDNPCTDDTCVDGTCVFTDNTSPCSDDVFCNGEERCADGVCQSGEAPCDDEARCSEARRACDACAERADCPEDAIQPMGECLFESACYTEGTQQRFESVFSCVNDQCVEQRNRVEPIACERPSQDGVECEPGLVCLGEICPRDYTVTASIGGNRTAGARLRVRCVATDETCIVAGNRPDHAMPGPCALPCPGGTEVEVCCSNGSDPCGGPESPPTPGRAIDEFSTRGFVGGDCPVNEEPVGPLQCVGQIQEADVQVFCSFTD